MNFALIAAQNAARSYVDKADPVDSVPSEAIRLVLDGETVSGDISADTISAVKAFLQNGTTWTGAGQIVTNANGSTSETPLEINVDATSAWVVTADTTVSVLNVAEGGKVVDAAGNAVKVVDASGAVLT